MEEYWYSINFEPPPPPVPIFLKKIVSLLLRSQIVYEVIIL